MTPTRRFFGTNLFAARRLQNIPRFWRRVAECLSSSIAIALLTFVCFRLEFGFATTAFLYLLIIILVSLRGSFLSSAVVSLIAVACLNYYFTPPLFTFRIDDWHDVVAIIAFWTTAAVITRLVSRSKEAEERIRQSEGELQQVVDVTPQLVAVFGPDRERLYANRPSLDYFGVPLKEWQSISDRFWFFHPDDRERVANDVYTGPAGDVPHEFEARLRRTDGVYRWFLFRDNPLRDEQGRITRWYLSATDIEDRKRAEENRQAQVWFLESMDRINRAMQGTNDLEQMTGDVIEAMLSIFDSERAFLYYPCDPDAPSFEVVMQRTRPKYAVPRDVIPMTPDTAKGFQIVLASTGVVTFGPGCDHPLVGDFAKRFGHKSSIGIALYPKTGKPWVLVMHQCSHARVWTPDERKLLEEIARRLADSLTSLLMFRSLRESEEALRRSEAYLAEAQKLTQTGTWAWDPRIDQIVYCSGEIFRIYGIDPRQGPPTTEILLERVHPEDRARLRERSFEGAHKSEEHRIEYRLLLPDGTVKHISSLRHPVLNRSGEVIEVVGTAMDITERKRAEEALRRSEAYLAESQRLTHTGSFAYIPGGAILYWSEETLRIWGFDQQQAILNHEMVRQRIHPDDRGRVRERAAKAVGTKTGWSDEFRIVLPDGTVKHIHAIHHPVFSASGELLEVAGTHVDVTERKRAEGNLRQSEEELRQLIDAIPQQVFVFDSDWNPLFANRRELEYTGLTPQEAQSKDAVARIFHPEDLTKLEVMRERMRTEGVPFEMEARIRGKDGEYRWFLIRDNPLRDERGRVLRWYGTRTDIEDRKRAEESLHRLNRELRAISNCNQTLLRAVDEQTLLNDICRIVCEEAGYRMAWVGYAQHDEAKTVRPVAWAGAEDGYLATANISWADTERGQGPGGTAIRSGTSVYTHDFATDPRYAPWRESALQHGFRSGLSVPLKDDNGDVFGEFAIYSAEPNAFTPDEVRLLEELAGDLAFGITVMRTRIERDEAEESLALRSFALNNVREAAFLTDKHARFHYVNEESCRILGYTREELLAMHVWDIDPDFPEERWPDHWGALKAQRSLTFEGRHRAKGGRVFPVEISANYSEYRGKAYNLALVRDITERKRAEEALRDAIIESEKQRDASQSASDELKTIFDSVPATVWYKDTKNNFLRVNRAVAALIGKAVEEIEGRSAWEVFPAEGDSYYADDLEVIRSRQPKVGIVESVTVADGTVRWVQTDKVPIVDHAGNVQSLVAFAVDITERKRAEEALRESETRFRTFVDHAGDALFVLDFEQGTIIDVNRQACESLGYTRQELIGKTPLAFHLDSDRATVESAAERAAGETVFDRHSHRRKDGSTFPVEVHTSVVSYGGRRFLLKVARDISDRLRTEEQREKLRQLEADLAHINRVSMMGELTASLAHEIRQPIAAAITSADACLRWLMRNPPDLERARLAVARVKDDGARAADVINRLRSFYKKGTPSEREMVDVNEVIREMIVLLRNEAIRHSVSVRPELAEGIPKVIADRVQLQQVLMNLMLNALEAMQDTGGELMIRSQLKQDGQLLISVSDAGVGLPAENANRIFDAFFTTKPQGSGMGLAITRSIVESHGGRLWATANDGPGATFHFTLHTEGEAQA